MNGLAAKAVVGFVQLVAAMLLFLFAPAWTFDFWQAWVFLAVFATSAAVITAYLWKNDPRLLERRVRGGPGAEKERRQQVIQSLAALAFIGLLVVPSLDHRFAWSAVPVPTVIAGDALVVIGFSCIFLVFRVNTFTAATIEVAADQQVITSGPYAIVRHPMYAGALVLLLGTPLALGSWRGLVVLAPMTAAIVWRLLAEEAFLSKNLPGYTEYARQVRHRLVPGVW